MHKFRGNHYYRRLFTFVLSAALIFVGSFSSAYLWPVMASETGAGETAAGEGTLDETAPGETVTVETPAETESPVQEPVPENESEAPADENAGG